ncbi:uncharacterized protein LOC114335311 [Diabrotica virgifera virgifera]|uniref:Uncharacterized protein LOC114335311 n=1 Tax=Diabrotica virgifera virgifera TaxID=50390 RepID=A0A6P7GA53_DIAVI|nr:uncharacterized protein LOC114335311 [Diabrotica virgifera virgifera]
MALFLLGLLFCLSSRISASGFYEISNIDFYNSVFTDSLDWRLLQELSNQYKNVVISPISLKIILSLLYQGSTGQTEREFQTLLNYQNKEYVRNNYSQIVAALYNADRTEYMLNIGTSMFVDEGLYVLSKFEDLARKSFKTDIIKTNFDKQEKASKDINSWVEQLTHGKVKKIVNADDLSQALMIITNAIYFKGTWTRKFDKNRSTLGNFYTSPDNIRSSRNLKLVQYMTTTDEFLYYEDRSLDAKIVRLEYKGSDYAMYIVLPNTLGGLSSLIKNVDINKIGTIKFQMTQQVVEVTIPKFKFNFDIKLGKILQKFGLREAFQNTASFTGIVQTNRTLRRSLYVSDIVQKSGIEVDEEGSEIFSASAVNVGNKFAENTMIFNASHPFMFFVDGPNGTILFVGQYENPDAVDPSEVPNRWSQEVEEKNPTEAVQFQNTRPSRPNNEIDQSNNVQFQQPRPNRPSVESQRPDNVQFQQNRPNRPNTENEQPSNVQGLNLNPNLDPDYYQPPDVEMDEIAYRFNLFDIDLLYSFSDLSTNVLISPASIKTTLAMILEGAEGTCAEEISEALRIPDINQKGVRSVLVELLNNLNERSTPNSVLESHNAIFVSEKHRLVDNYKNVVIKYYNAYLKSLDFSNSDYAARVINGWISDSTHGEITDVISPQGIVPDCYVVLSNALFFKAQWKYAFDKRSVRKCFHTPRGCVYVDMMHISHNFNYNYITRLRANVVDIPYQDKFSMLLILPSSDSNVRSVIRDLPHFRLSSILESLNQSEIVLELPTFSFEYSADLVEFLKPLKIREIFGSRANLTKMIEGHHGMINNLLHKTKITVDEKGTTAAASSSAMIIPLMQPVTVAADRPFVFMIYHRDTKNIIFEGIVQNPLEK